MTEVQFPHAILISINNTNRHAKRGKYGKAQNTLFIMKTVSKFLAMAFIMFSMAFIAPSCSSDNDDEPSIDQTLLLGKTWFSINDYEDSAKVEFMANGTMRITTTDSESGMIETATGRYTISGNKIVITQTWDNDDYGDTEIITGKIKTLTESMLVLELDEDGDKYTLTLYAY